MKKYVTLSLFVFWAIIVAVIVAGLITYNKNNQLGAPANTAGASQLASNITGVGSDVTTLVLSMNELAKHNSSQSCWLLISGKIYDVTTFLNQHPGEASTILPTCGTDATVAYDTKGRPYGNTPHSANASSILADYFIGNLNQTLKTGSNQNTATGTKTTTTTPSAKSSPSPTVALTPAPAINPTVQNTSLALTSAELAKHNSSQSCWLLISGKIYDVTTFLFLHPGNASTILPTCGTDATIAYETRGGTGAHSSSANAMLADYYIGNFNQTITTNPTSPNNPPVANPNPTPPRRGGDDGGDDD